MPDLPSIHLPPPAANERLLPGYGKGDLISGAHNRGAIGVLVDLRTLFLMLVRMPWGGAAEAALAGFS